MGVFEDFKMNIIFARVSLKIIKRGNGSESLDAAICTEHSLNITLTTGYVSRLSISKVRSHLTANKFSE